MRKLVRSLINAANRGFTEEAQFIQSLSHEQRAWLERYKLENNIW